MVNSMNAWSSRYGRWAVSLSLAAACLALVMAFSARPEPLPSDTDRNEQVLRGRLLVLHHACGDCHGGGGNPAAPNWLTGWNPSSPPGGFQDFQIGPYHVYARNLTPDNTTGLGRFSERQIFNALRYGLRPGETPDVEITSTTPGEGNYPARPKYLAVAMPWPVFRHMSDQELWDIAAYLKHGLKPVKNPVPDSEGPPDFWASEYTPEKVGTYPAPPFPTANEMSLKTSSR
ncbi:MAG: c-type cytochrome [Rhodothermales bacterium]|nr:c-type cytochrome [Rhodothermales bacterium]